MTGETGIDRPEPRSTKERVFLAAHADKLSERGNVVVLPSHVSDGCSDACAKKPRTRAKGRGRSGFWDRAHISVLCSCYTTSEGASKLERASALARALSSRDQADYFARHFGLRHRQLSTQTTNRLYIADIS